MTPTQIALTLDIKSLTTNQQAWLHKLKNEAMVRRLREQLKAMKEKAGV